MAASGSGVGILNLRTSLTAVISRSMAKFLRGNGLEFTAVMRTSATLEKDALNEMYTTRPSLTSTLNGGGRPGEKTSHNGWLGFRPPTSLAALFLESKSHRDILCVAVNTQSATNPHPCQVAQDTDYAPPVHPPQA